MTENTTRTATAAKMKTVDHTHPDTDRPFGEAVVYQRGPTVAADGGERSEASRTSKDRTSFGSEPSEARRASEGEREAVEDASDDEEVEREMAEKQMKDVDHKPPNEAEANRVFKRGREGRDDAR